MATLDLNGLNSLRINGKEVKSVSFQGKEVKFKYTVSFNTNMASGRYYYLSGQDGAATKQAAPASRAITIGSTIGTLPTIGSSSSGLAYTLGGYTYSIYVTGWYKEQALTNQVTASWVPTSDCTLYAKWAMTANVTISTAVTIPKFASGVSWTCYSNGGSRSAVTATCSSSAYSQAVAMSAPGANRTSDSYTWSGCGGKTITALSATSMTLNGVTRSVTTPGAGGSWTQKYKITDYISFSSTSGTSAGSKTFSSGNYKVVLSWPDMKRVGTYNVTAKFYYANAEKTSRTACTFKVSDDDDNDLYLALSSQGSNQNGTFASGTYGAAGGWAITQMAWTSQHNSSIAAASGTGASRTITVNK